MEIGSGLFVFDFLLPGVELTDENGDLSSTAEDVDSCLEVVETPLAGSS